MVAVNLNDPYAQSPDARITVLRSLRHDFLARLLAGKRIDQAQFVARSGSRWETGQRPLSLLDDLVSAGEQRRPRHLPHPVMSCLRNRILIRACAGYGRYAYHSLLDFRFNLHHRTLRRA